METLTIVQGKLVPVWTLLAIVWFCQPQARMVRDGNPIVQGKLVPAWRLLAIFWFYQPHLVWSERIQTLSKSIVTFLVFTK